MFGGNSEMSLSEIQQEIVDTHGNMIVSASAGTGKTHTMVAKIEKEIEDNHTHKVIAAITFTVKAAKEIKERLKIDSSDHSIGTNNSFVIEEIIKPFAKDVYGDEFKGDINTDYSIKKNTFEEGLAYLSEYKTICSYADNEKNFVFDLALRIVKQSAACRLFLKAKYIKIYVDEYQDCDQMMHEFFMYICKTLKIDLFVVGDPKQSIYIWRGAYPEAFRSIFLMDDFQKKVLRDNYRSCQQIQNYSNLLTDETRSLYTPCSDKSAILLVNANSYNWVGKVCDHLDLNKTCALLRFSNRNAQIGAEELSQMGTPFTYIPRTPISDITTDVSWLYNAIAQYFILKEYSIYDFMDEIPEESVGDRKIKQYLKEKLNFIEKALNNKLYGDVIQEVENIAAYFGYTSSENNIKKLIATINDEEYHAAFKMDELQHVSITFHSSKGLEFDQVIVFANDYQLDDNDSICNHYVAVTRAKSRLIIVKLCDYKQYNGMKYFDNLTKMFEKAGIRPDDVMQIIE